MENFECSICLEKFDNPIECTNCHNNFCRKHIKDFRNTCPICKSCPFSFRENIWLSRTIANIDYSYKCSLCTYEGDKNSFWSHLIENHKNEIIQQYNSNDNSNKKKKNINNEKNSNKIFEDNQQNTQPDKNNQTPEQINIFNNNSNKDDNNIYNKNNVGNKYPDFNQLNKNDIIRKSSNNEIKPPFTHRQNYPIDNKRISPVKELTNRPPSERNSIQYCGHRNESIKCNCCPDHICKRGNCLCVRCMRININNFKFREGELINRAGRIAKPFKGSYYCECLYEEIITNVIGLQFKKQSQCRYPLESCKDCKVLNKFKNVYLG